MRSGDRYRLAKEEGRLRETYHRDLEEVSGHGCWENLSRVLGPFGIAPEDVPSPFNLFRTMKIDGATSRMEHTAIRPSSVAHVDLRAELDLFVALSACPDLAVGGKPVGVVYEI
jgi:hypothetical protein